MVAAKRLSATGPVAVFLLVFILGAPSLLYPFARDQGEYAYTAVAALAGKAIYRDVFNVKPPLTHIVHEIALVAFGRSMLAIRVLDLVWQGATAVAVALVAGRIWRRPGAGLLAALVYGLSYYLFDFWNTAQTDGFLTLPAALGVLAFLVARERDRGWAYWACGAALGVATLFKYPIGLLLPLLVLLAMRPWPRPGRRRALQLATGFAAPLLVCVAALAAQHTLGDFLYVQRTYIPCYVSGHGERPYLADAVGHLLLLRWHNVLLWVSAIALAGELALARRKGATLELLPLAFWWLAALANLAAQNKGADYHALPLLAPAAIILACLPFAAHDSARIPRPARIALVGLGEILLLAVLLLYLTQEYPCNHVTLARVLVGRERLETVYKASAFVVPHGKGIYSVRGQLEVARYIEAHSAPADKVFVWGFEPTIYFAARRECASRFIYNYPLYGDFPWPQLKAAFLADMHRNPPLYFIVVRNDPIPWVTGTDDDSTVALAKFPELVDLIATGYEREAAIEQFTLYRRKG